MSEWLCLLTALLLRSSFLSVGLIHSYGIIKNGRTALYYALSADMAKLLVENKADPLAKDVVRILCVKEQAEKERKRGR